MSDPRLILTGSGSRLQFIGGQPLLDDGLENLVLISLFTRNGWCGNVLFNEPIGSTFEEECNKPITRNSLNRIRNAAELALTNPLFGKVTVSVTNPQSYHLSVSIVIEAPGRTKTTLQLFRSGGAWFYQSSDPAYTRVLNNVMPRVILDEGFILDQSALV